MTDTFDILDKYPNQTEGWLQTQLSKEVMMVLQSYIEEAKNNPISMNKELAGTISTSLSLKDKDNWFFGNILVPFLKKYTKCYPEYMRTISTLTSDVPYCLNLFWVNFQKQHEFNPLHDHGGVFSFVIWVKIPTDWREQHAIPISANSTNPIASNFEFQFVTMLGHPSRYTYLLDKKSEGGMLFFPSQLQHTVYPFYECDEERISISGNIYLDTRGVDELE